MKSLKNLKKLARDLTIEEIAEVILLKSNEDNINSELNHEVSESLDCFSHDLNSLNRVFKAKKRGFVVHRAFHYDNLIGNIDSLVELAYNRDSKIKRKYLKLNYHALKFLKTTGFLTITESDEDSSNLDDIVHATDKLVTFLEERQVEHNRWNFNTVNEELIAHIIEILFTEKGEVVKEYWEK